MTEKELKAQIKDLGESLDIMNNREAELLAQIEKMKCCENCKHWVESFDNSCVCENCEHMDKWEIAE